MKSNTTRISENALAKMISESVKKAISEGMYEQMMAQSPSNYQQEADKKVRMCMSKGRGVTWTDFYGALSSVVSLLSSQMSGKSPYFKYLNGLLNVAFNKSQGENGGNAGMAMKPGDNGTPFGGGWGQ